LVEEPQGINRPGYPAGSADRLDEGREAHTRAEEIKTVFSLAFSILFILVLLIVTSIAVFFSLLVLVVSFSDERYPSNVPPDDCEWRK